METPDPDPTTAGHFVPLVAAQKLILLSIMFYLKIIYTYKGGILLYIMQHENLTIGAEKMVYLIKTLDALVEDLGSVPSTHEMAHNHLLVYFQIGCPLLNSAGTRNACGAYTHRQTRLLYT